MELPEDYRYSKDYTWLKLIENNEALVGITDFAQNELGEIVYVDLPEIGKQFNKGEVFGTVEAVKTTSDLFMPATGEILEINTALKENASLVNSSSYSHGWMIKIKLVDAPETNALLNADAYKSLVSYGYDKIIFLSLRI